MLERVLQEIRARHRFVVTSHARPDGDGIGSALACGQILRVVFSSTLTITRAGAISPTLTGSIPT